MSLTDDVLAVLQEQTGPVSEYDLLKRLADKGVEPFFKVDFRDQLALFRAHFLLFNSLYVLQERLFIQQGLALEISPLAIFLGKPSAFGESSLPVAEDPLRSYYLDFAHYHVTTRDQIDEWLGLFWSRLSSDERRREALRVLELTDPVDDGVIQRQYRRLVMHHHPDRGGDTVKVQALNAAYRLLCKR